METNIQPNNEQPIPSQPETSAQGAESAPQPAGNKKFPTGLIIAIVTVVVIVAGVLIFMAFLNSSPSQTTLPSVSQTPSPSSQSYQQLPTSEAEDSTTSINQQLDSTSIDDVDSQFKNIDSDLNQL